VDVELVVPEPVQTRSRPLFMMHCDLVTDGGAVLQSARRALMLQPRSPVVATVRHLILLPFYLLGLRSENEVVKAHAIAKHRERGRAPLAAVRVLLRGDAAGVPPPLVRSARVRVHVNKSAHPGRSCAGRGSCRSAPG
jgi:Putative adipose-regulatory protein (Seipin)